MKWIVGLDLRPSSQGAIEFAGWLAQTSKEDEYFIGLHVLEEEHLRVVLRYHHLDEVVNTARDAALKMLDEKGLAQRLGDPHIVQGLHAEQSLEAARVYHHADAIVIGRQAKTEGRHLIRLGRVARRLLRTLPAPVVVVPPDLGAKGMGSGPILALTKLTDDSVDACKLAVDMGKRLGREVLVTHVVPLPEEYGAQYLPEASLDKLRSEHFDTGTEQLQAWCQNHGFTGVKSRVLQGQLSQQVCQLAEDTDATLMVVGSRRLTMFERMLLTSVGSELAAVGPCPVAVVPPAGES